MYKIIDLKNHRQSLINGPFLFSELSDSFCFHGADGPEFLSEAQKNHFMNLAESDSEKTSGRH